MSCEKLVYVHNTSQLLFIPSLTLSPSVSGSLEENSASLLPFIYLLSQSLTLQFRLTLTHYVAKGGLEFTVILSLQPSECWDFKCMPPWSAFIYVLVCCLSIFWVFHMRDTICYLRCCVWFISLNLMLFLLLTLFSSILQFLCLCAGMATMKNHKLDGLTQQHLLSQSSGGSKCEIKVWEGVCSVSGCRSNCLMLLSEVFVAFWNLWCSLSCRNIRKQRNCSFRVRGSFYI